MRELVNIFKINAADDCYLMSDDLGEVLDDYGDNTFERRAGQYQTGGFPVLRKRNHTRPCLMMILINDDGNAQDGDDDDDNNDGGDPHTTLPDNDFNETLPPPDSKNTPKLPTWEGNLAKLFQTLLSNFHNI